jgi:catechol 2,3-dioxygenase-like lactoylglutathione lyase family enzyme
MSPLPPPPGILETVLSASDLDAAEAFYTGVLGFQLHSKVAGRHIFFRCGEQMLLIFNPAETIKGPSAGALPVPPHGAPEASGAGHVCFRATAPEITRWRTHLQQAGVAIEADFIWPASGGRSIYFRDPAGNSLEFAEPKIWGLS